MLHHISLPVSNPLHVANVLSEILYGNVLSCPQSPDVYKVLQNDEYGSVIELIPSGNEIIPGKEKNQYKHNFYQSKFSPVHVAISVPLTFEEIKKIAIRESWHVGIGNRGRFEVVEFWLENKLLIEFILSSTIPQYVKSMTLREFIVLDIVMGLLKKIKKIKSIFFITTNSN